MGYTAACVLSGVFLLAGVVKLVRLPETQAAFIDLQIPWPRALSRVVPVVEIGTATLVAVSPRVGAAVVLALLAGFSAILGRAITKGLDASCGCLGGGGDEPVTGVELVRNGMLAALAFLATRAQHPELPSFPEVVVVSTAVAVGLVGLGVLRLKRDLGVVWDNRLPPEILS